MNFVPRDHLDQLLRTAASSVAPDAVIEIHLERPKQATHGDFACNLAMQLARILKASPRDIANQLVAALPASEWITKVEIAGAGFINFYLCQTAKTVAIHNVLASTSQYGQGVCNSSARKLLIEFVSANPTGPLHVGHGRGAAYGASLASLLEFSGHQVTREYYVNDAGRQMDILGLSTWLRYLELFNICVQFPPNAYQGDYVCVMAKQLQQTYDSRFLLSANRILEVMSPAPEGTTGNDDTDDSNNHAHLETKLDNLIEAAKSLLGEDWPVIHQYALDQQLEDCRTDLEEFGVNFEHWFSEQKLFATNKVTGVVNTLKERGHLYEKDGAQWFRSTAFGDEKDRVVQRENGAYTYFATDIAYHAEKFARGFDHMINIWGADHHGYVARVRGALRALGLDDKRLAISLVQFVSLYRDGSKVAMSTRAGEYVTLRQLRNEVGNDACRFFYVQRRCDQALDFDLTLAKADNLNNPVYYVQYAHARISSVLSQWEGDVTDLSNTDLSPLVSARELSLCSQIEQFPDIVATAATEYAPHSVAFYLRNLASEFHSWYNAERLLVDEMPLRLARLSLAAAVRQVLKNGLTLLGVSAPEVM